MLHEKRRFMVGHVANPGELAEKLTKHSWVLCNGFQLGKTVWLNDSTSEDALQEYAVFIEVEPGRWRQWESITVSWCSPEEIVNHAQQAIRVVMTGASDFWFSAKVDEGLAPRLQTAKEHGSCSLCR